MSDRDAVLSTGRRFYCRDDVIGIGPDLDIAGGWDDVVPSADHSWMTDGERMAPAEMVELADIMLDRWTRFRAKWISATGSCENGSTGQQTEPPNTLVPPSYHDDRPGM